LLILVKQYPNNKDEIYKFYLKNTKHINNWDLVDLSAPNIVGDYLLDKPAQRKILYKLARSTSLWEKRIAILATFAFIRNGEYKDTLTISEILVDDKHDLIHKAVGWMLREVGKRIGEDKEELFLKKHYKTMPRTMLRYAIERFPDNKRKFYMKKDH
jgi:3-methyladenine DNA glycosylase AlkD